MEKIQVKIKKLSNYKFDDLPKQESIGAAGIDARACIDRPVTLMVGQMIKIPLGFSVEIPEGFEGQVRPRSGLASKFGVTVLNAPGTVDCDYRGEVQVLLVRASEHIVDVSGPITERKILPEFTINPGDRICQLVFAPVPFVTLVESEELSVTSRGTNGFGSTGIA